MFAYFYPNLSSRLNVFDLSLIITLFSFPICICLFQITNVQRCLPQGRFAFAHFLQLAISFAHFLRFFCALFSHTNQEQLVISGREKMACTGNH